jgi:hypothetical protein
MLNLLYHVVTFCFSFFVHLHMQLPSGATFAESIKVASVSDSCKILLADQKIGKQTVM